MKNLYVGAAGVVRALDALRRRGHAETSLDLAAAASRMLESSVPADSTADEHYHPAALLCGEPGPPLVAFRLAPNPALADDRHGPSAPTTPTRPTTSNSGAPGMLLAARRWRMDRRAAVGGGGARVGRSPARRRGDDGLWRQDDDYRGLGTLHLAAGNTLAVRVDWTTARRRTAAAPRGSVFREDGLAYLPGSPRSSQLLMPRAGRIRSSGARVLRVSSPAPGSTSISAAARRRRTTGRAGAHGDEKGHGICHGTSGTGSHSSRRSRVPATTWLERARRFAVHALGQVEASAPQGRGRHALWTGDVGTALFAAACLDLDARTRSSTSSRASPAKPVRPSVGLWCWRAFLAAPCGSR